MNKAAAAASFMASFRWPAGITRMGRCHGMHGPSSAVVLGGTWKLKASNHSIITQVSRVWRAVLGGRWGGMASSNVVARIWLLPTSAWLTTR